MEVVQGGLAPVSKCLNILDLPTEIIFEIISYLQFPYVKRLSCVSKDFLELTKPYFARKTFLNIKKLVSCNRQLFRNYSNIAVNCTLQNPSIQNLINLNSKSLKELILNKYCLQEDPLVIPERCQIESCSLRQDLHFFEESEKDLVEEDLLRILKFQSHLLELVLSYFTLTRRLFESVSVFKKLDISNCSIRRLSSPVTNTFEHLQSASVANCTFETLEDINFFLNGLRNVTSLSLMGNLCRQFDQGNIHVEMPNLTSLHITYCKGICWIEAPALKSLSTTGVNFEPGQSYATFLKKSTNLESFTCNDDLGRNAFHIIRTLVKVKYFDVIIDILKHEVLEFILSNFKSTIVGKITTDRKYLPAEEDLHTFKTMHQYYYSDCDEVLTFHKENCEISVHQYDDGRYDSDDYDYRHGSDYCL